MRWVWSKEAQKRIYQAETSNWYCCKIAWKELDELRTSADTKKDMAAIEAKSFEKTVMPILIKSNKEKYF